MGIAYNTSIVRDGLVLHLDAANDKSYPGSGTTWSDLSYTGLSCSIPNGITYNTTNNGTLTFDGSSNYVEVPYDISNNLVNSSLTVNMWAKSNFGSSTGWNTYWCGVSKYSQFILGPNGSGDGAKMAFLIYAGGWLPNSYSSAIWGQTNIDPREYHYYTGMYSRDSGILSLFVDGKEEVSFDIGLVNISADAASFTIGKRDVSGNYINANIPNVSIYNKALTADEVLKNFEATRGRYGI